MEESSDDEIEILYEHIDLSSNEPDIIEIANIFTSRKASSFSKNNKTTSPITYLYEAKDDAVICYTDGSHSKLKNHLSFSGIGVCFGDTSPFNISESLKNKEIQNSSCAEIMAAVSACKKIKQMGKKKLIIRTDSKQIIDLVDFKIRDYIQNGWKNSKGQAVKSKEAILNLMDAMKGLDVQFVKVKAHAGVEGNELADQLAKKGMRRMKKLANIVNNEGYVPVKQDFKIQTPDFIPINPIKRSKSKTRKSGIQKPIKRNKKKVQNYRKIVRSDAIKNKLSAVAPSSLWKKTKQN